MPCAAAAASAFLHIATGEDGFKKKKYFTVLPDLSNQIFLSITAIASFPKKKSAFGSHLVAQEC